MNAMRQQQTREGAPLQSQETYREVKRCGNKRCNLYDKPQYMTINGLCRWCLLTLPGIKLQPVPLVPRWRAQKTKGEEFLEPSTNREIAKLIGERMRELRKSRGLTQEQLHECSGVSRSNISLMEGGERTPGLRALEKVAGGAGYDLRHLFCIPRSEREMLMNDWFIRSIIKGGLIRKLNWDQWLFVIKTIKAAPKSPAGQEKTKR